MVFKDKILRNIQIVYFCDNLRCWIIENILSADQKSNMSGDNPSDTLD
jgi:hypothetical protein